MKKIIFLLLTQFISSTSWSQGIGSEPDQLLTLDLSTGFFNKKYLPFDVPFKIASKIDSNINGIVIVFYPVNKNSDTLATAQALKITSTRTLKSVSQNTPETNIADISSTIKNAIISTPWSRNIYAGAKKIDSFKVRMPPLQVYRSYQMKVFITASPNLYDSTPDSLKARIYRQIKFSFIEFYKSRVSYLSRQKAIIINEDYLATNWTGELQTDLRDIVSNYYLSKGVPSENINFDSTLLGLKRIKNFDSLITSKLNFTQAFQDLKTLRTNVEYQDSISQLKVEAVRNFTKLLSNIYSVADSFGLSNTDKMLLYKLAYESNIFRIAGDGRADYISNVMIKDHPYEKFAAVDLDIYLRNASELRDDIISLKRDLHTNLFFSTTAKALRNKKQIGLVPKDSALIGSLFEYGISVTGTIEYISDYKDYLVTLENLFHKFRLSLFKDFKLSANLPAVSITAEFVTRGEWYIMPDVGIADLWFSGDAFGSGNSIVPYFGVNFNLFPVNRQVHYTLFNNYPKIESLGSNLKTFGGRLIKNMSLSVGLTTSSLKDASHFRDNTFTDLNLSLLTGVGIRISDAFRLSLGEVWVRYPRTDPLIGATNKIKPVMYASFSLDVDLKKYLGAIGSKLFPSN